MATKEVSKEVNADDFSSKADRLIELLGKDLVGQEIARWASGSAPQAPLGVFDIRRALANAESWKAVLREGGGIDDPQDLLRFAMVAETVVQASILPGSDVWLKTLRDYLASGSLDQFEDTLFEGEVALSCQARAKSVRFGPQSGQPDVFVDLDVSGSLLLFGIECKRIQPTSTESREFNDLAEAFERRCEPVLGAGGGLKAIVKMHREVKEENFVGAEQLLRALASSLPVESSAFQWRTATDPNGRFQVSVARLGPAGIFQDGTPTVTDVPADPIVVGREEMVRVDEKGYRSRLKSLLSIRRDDPPDPVGNLRGNLLKAMEQLRPLFPMRHGKVALRVRPPRSLSDLWEADRVVREALSSQDSQHVALVILFWEEANEERGTAVGDTAPPVTRVLRSLKPYLIANGKALVQFKDDSRSQYFEQEPEAFYRDPDSGRLIPIAMDRMAAIERGDEFPEPFRQLIRVVEDKYEEEAVFTLYASFKEELAEVVKKATGGILIGGINAGQRRFRVFIDRNADLRILEFRGRNITAVTSIDLRAWLSEKELGYVLSWGTAGFQVALSAPDEKERFLALSTSVRPA